MQWQGLRTVLGNPDWARRPELTTASGRLSGHDEIDEQLAAWTRERSARDITSELLAAGVPAGHVQRSSDLLVDPQLEHRRFFREYEHPEIGRVPYSGHQFRVSGYDNGPRCPAPLLGADSFEILSEALVFDDEAIAELVAEGAIA